MLVCFEMIILTIVTSVAYSYKDFQAGSAGRLKKRLLLHVVKDNLKEQLKDLAEFDAIKNLPFPKKERPVQIDEKEMTTIYVDKKGNLTNAEIETKARLFQGSIHVDHDAIKIDD